MQTLKRRYTIVIVTHNMQQAARVAELTAFFSLEVSGGKRPGALVEYDETERMFTRPRTRARATTSQAASAEQRLLGRAAAATLIASLGDMLEQRLAALPAVDRAAAVRRAAGAAGARVPVSSMRRMRSTSLSSASTSCRSRPSFDRAPRRERGRGSPSRRSARRDPTAVRRSARSARRGGARDRPPTRPRSRPPPERATARQAAARWAAPDRCVADERSDPASHRVSNLPVPPGSCQLACGVVVSVLFFFTEEFTGEVTVLVALAASRAAHFDGLGREARRGGGLIADLLGGGFGRARFGGGRAARRPGGARAVSPVPGSPRHPRRRPSRPERLGPLGLRAVARAADQDADAHREQQSAHPRDQRAARRHPRSSGVRRLARRAGGARAVRHGGETPLAAPFSALHAVALIEAIGAPHCAQRSSLALATACAGRVTGEPLGSRLPVSRLVGASSASGNVVTSTESMGSLLKGAARPEPEPQRFV